MASSDLIFTNFQKKIFFISTISLIALVIGLLVARGPIPIVFWGAVILFPILVYWAFRSDESIFIFWLIASPLLREYINYGGGGLPNITIDRILLIFLIFWFIGKNLQNVLAKKSLGKNNPIIILIAGIYLISEFSGYWRGPDSKSTLLQYYLDRIFLPVMVFYFTNRFTREKGEKFVNHFFKSLLVVCIYSVFIEVLRRYAGLENLIYPNERTFIWADVIGTRAVGNFYNPAIFGGIIILGMAVLYYRDYLSGKNWIKWGVIMAFLWAIIFSYTRAVWLSLVVFSIFSLVIKSSDKLFRVLTLTTIIVGLLVFSLGYLESEQNFQERLMDQTNIIIRQDLIKDSIDLFVQKPLFGWGAGYFDKLHFISVWDSFMGQTRTVGAPSHNSFLLMLADRGLISFLSYILLVIYLVVRSIHLFLKRPLSIKYLGICWVMILNYLVIGNSIQVDYFPYFICIFWGVLGILDGLSTKDLIFSFDVLYKKKDIKL